MGLIDLPFETYVDRAIRLREEWRASKAEHRVRFCKSCTRIAHRPMIWEQLDNVINHEGFGLSAFKAFEDHLRCDRCRRMTGPLTGEGFISIYRLTGFDGVVRALNDHYSQGL